MKLLGSDGLSHNSLCLPRQSLEMSAQCVSEAQKMRATNFLSLRRVQNCSCAIFVSRRAAIGKGEKRNEANEGIVRTTLGFSESARILRMGYKVCPAENRQKSRLCRANTESVCLTHRHRRARRGGGSRVCGYRKRSIVNPKVVRVQ